MSDKKIELPEDAVYREHGFDNRVDYLKSLADEYDLPQILVNQFANLMGRSEDFDGLVSMCKDAEGKDW